MNLLKKFDYKVFIVLSSLIIAIDYFKDTDFGTNDIVLGLVSGLVGTVIWAFVKDIVI